ncbi:DUF6804 family protein [Curtobacterium sp. L1-20]|uniref:DUF6804 family protein n=1 Tax=Curtobacterium sp. L1-20 TaxID=3138181 RepID=UPI003B52D9FE
MGSSQNGVPAGAGRPATVASSRSSGALPPFTRPALAPSLIAAIVLLACVAIVDSSGFVFARWGVTVLSLIVLVFAVRGRAWWAVVLMAAVAVCWNPLEVVPIPGEVWAALQLVAAAVFIVVGILVKVPRETVASSASRPAPPTR